MRVEGNLLWDRERGDEQLEDLVELRSVGSVGRLRIRGAKIFTDGVLENFTGALLEPYVGTDNYGISMVAREDLLRIVVLLDARDFQVHMHTIGDRAVRDALDAVEAAQERKRPAGYPAPPRASPARPPRRSAPVRRARRRRQRLALLGLPQRLRRGADGALHRPGALGAHVPVREPAAGRRPPRLRERLDRVDGEPAAWRSRSP